MPQTGTTIAFIVLMAIVIIGVIVYVYMTMSSQQKERQKSASQPDSPKPPTAQGSASFAEFSALVNQNQKAEIVLPLLDLYTAKIRIANMLNAPGALGISPLRLDRNLDAECTVCGKRIAGVSFAPPATDTCETPECSSKFYKLRWLAITEIPEEMQPTSGWVD